jgi:hypothetical protein
MSASLAQGWGANVSSWFRRSDAGARAQADRIHHRLVAGGLGGTLGGAFAIVEDLDLLHVLEGLLQRGLGLVELALQVVGRLEQVVAAPERSLGIGRISEMGGIRDAGTGFLGLDLAIEIARHPVKIGDHHLDLAYPATLLVDLEALEAKKRLSRLHVVFNS